MPRFGRSGHFVAIAALTLSVARVAFAQSDTARPQTSAGVLVQVVDRLSGAPVQGGLLSLVVGDGTTVAQGLTDARGVRLLSTTAPGEYRVRVRRIGFVPFTSDPVRLESGVTARLTLAIPSVPVTLTPITATAQAKACRRSDAGQLASSDLWNQIRIVLEATELRTTGTSSTTLLRTFDGVLAPSGALRDLVAATHVLGHGLYESPVSPAELSRRGYAMADRSAPLAGRAPPLRFDGPDPHVLLSPEFENDHCFSAVAGRGVTAGLVGLSFTPVSDRLVADISGVLWVALPSYRLTYLDYTYVNFPTLRGAPDAGGRMVFDRLPDGQWTVQDWVIRGPLFLSNGALSSGYHASGGWEELVTGGPAPVLGDPLVVRDGSVLLRGRCPDTTRALSVRVTPMPVVVPLANPSADTAGGAMVEISWFGSPDVDGTRRPIGLSQVVETNRSGSALLCLPRRDGQPVAVAYWSRSASPTTLVASDGASPSTLELRLDDRALRPQRDLPIPTGPSRIDVMVRGSGGEPLEGASLAVNGLHYSASTTDAAGHLVVGDLPSGLAIVDLWRAGYDRLRVLVDLGSRRARPIEIQMAPSDMRAGGLDQDIERRRAPH